MGEENILSSYQSQVPKGAYQSHGKFSSSSVCQEGLIVGNSNFPSLHQSGGIDSIAAALESNPETGICGDDEDLRRRHEMFGSNHNLVENSAQRHFRQGILNAIKDDTVILTSFCLLLSLVLEIKNNGIQREILSGLITFVVIFTTTTISQVVKLLQNRRKETSLRMKKAVTVKRDGRVRQIAVSEVVVGDLVCLKTGDEVPADGLIVSGSNGLKLDDDDDNDHVEDYSHHHIPSVFSGSKLVGGECCTLVTNVGKDTETSKMMILLKGDQIKEYSEFQIGVDRMNLRLEKIMLSISLLVLAVQVFRCFARGTGRHDSQHPDPKGVKDTVADIMAKATSIIKRQGGRLNRFVEMICVLVFATRDGLPLELLISSVYASKKFARCGGIVQNLPTCGTLGFVTTICTGKTGDLRLEQAKMVDLWIGTDIVGESILIGGNTNVLNALRLGIGMNTSESADEELLCWAKQVLGVDREEMKQNWIIEASEIQDNRTGLLLRWNGDDSKTYVNLHWKGAPDIILSMCTHYFDKHGTLQALDERKRDVFKKNIEDIASDSLQCIAFACKQVEEDEEGIVELADNRLTLLAILGLKNPYKYEVKQAIEACGELGVKIKLIVGNDTNTARLIAINSGILKPEEDANEAVVEASVFRNNSELSRSVIAGNIRVMANASPLDKLQLLQCLKQKGEVVAVTGMCTRDSPSLKEANVGLLLGDSSPEVLKENSDIVILDKNFVTIVDMLMLGKCVLNNSKKFIQLQLTLNMTSFIVNLIAAVSFGEVALASFQLLWANFVVEVLGALALGLLTDPAVHGASSSLTTKALWRNIIVQVLYQVSFFLALKFKGKELLHASEKVIEVIVFNTLVLCQPFVLIYAEETEKPNIFRGMTSHQSRWFLVIVGTIIILQLVIIEIIPAVTHGERLNIENWCACIGIAAMSTPIGLVAKWVSWP